MLRNIFLVVLTLAMVAAIWVVLTSKPSNKHVCEDVYCRVQLGMLESELPALLDDPSSIVMGEPRKLSTVDGARTIIYDTTHGTYQVKVYTNGDEQIAVAVSGGRVLATEYRVCLHSVCYLGPKTIVHAGSTGTLPARPERANSIERRIAALLGKTPTTPVTAEQAVTPSQGEDAAREKIADLNAAFQVVVNELNKQTGQIIPANGPELVWFYRWLSQAGEFECSAMADEATEGGVASKCKEAGLPGSYSEKWARFIAAKSAARQAIAKCESKELEEQLKQLCTWRETGDAYRQNIMNMREQVAMNLRAFLQCNTDAGFAGFSKLDPSIQEKLIKLCIKAGKERLGEEDVRFISGYTGISRVLDAAEDAHKAAAEDSGRAGMSPVPDSARGARKAPAKDEGSPYFDRKLKPIRAWTSRGGHTVTARFVSKFGDKVRLQTEDKREITVDVAQLSDEDRQYLQSLSR